MENLDHHNNTLIQEGDQDEDIKFSYNFITIPWDDRSAKSKIGALLLLLAIFAATIACVVNSFIMQFKGYHKNKMGSGNDTMEGGINCQLVKVEDYSYAVRIHSVNNELICLGALISEKVVLSNGACVTSNHIRLYVGGLTDYYCKKGFAPLSIEQVPHDGVMSKKMVILIFRENLAKCGSPISIGPVLGHAGKAYVIGRAVIGPGGRTISKHPVTVIGTGKNCSCPGLHAKLVDNVICVQSVVKCPVLVSDLLIQHGKLYGLSSTSVNRKDRSESCFADLLSVAKDLKEIFD